MWEDFKAIDIKNTNEQVSISYHATIIDLSVDELDHSFEQSEVQLTRHSVEGLFGSFLGVWTDHVISIDCCLLTQKILLKLILRYLQQLGHNGRRIAFSHSCVLLSGIMSECHVPHVKYGS